MKFMMARRSSLMAGAAVLALLAETPGGSAQTAEMAHPAPAGNGAQPAPAADGSQPASAGNSSQPAGNAPEIASGNSEVGVTDVIVTSRKRTEILREVPVAVDVITHTEAEQLGVKSLADVAALSPGVTFDEGISRVDTRPSIRGFYTQRGRPSVAVLIDGFDTTTESIASAGGGFEVNLNLLDLDRIEVVKGPQAALYGRNAFGGAINYITAKPTSVPTGEISTEVGNYGDYKTFGTFSNSLNDKVSYRASLEADGIGGFYDNTVTGKKVGGHDTQGGSVDWLIRPNDKVTIRVYTEVGHSIFRQDAAVNIASNTQLHNFSLASTSALTVPQVVGTIGANASEVAYSANYPGSRTTTVRNFVSVDWDLDWAVFASRTGFQTTHNRLTQDTDYEAAANPLAFFGYANELQDFTYDTTQVSQEFRLTSPDTSKLKWLGGLYTFYEGATLIDYTQYYLDHLSKADPNARLAPTANSTLNPPTYTGRDTYHASMYGSVGYEVLPKLNATVEARVAYEGVDASKPDASRTAISEYTSPITYGPGGVPLGITYSNAQVTSRYINPKFSLDYALTPTQNLYADISRGTKPAGVSLLNISGGTFAGQQYKQEKVWEYELGDKVSFLHDRLQINGDVYFNDYHDQQVSYTDLNVNPPPTGVTNAGSVYGIGQEIEVAARPIPPVTLNIGYSHINMYYKDYRSTQASDLEYVNGDFDNKKVPNTPPHMITANARYETEIYQPWDVEAFVQVSALYESARFANDYNTIKLGAFIEPKFQVGFENQKYSLLFFMNNPFNDKTIRSAIGYFDLHRDFLPTALAFLPDPQTFGARFTYRF